MAKSDQTKYFRLMLGRGSEFAQLCRSENFIAIDFDAQRDLSEIAKTTRTAFRKDYAVEMASLGQRLTEQSSGRRADQLWNFVNQISDGDVICSPDGHGGYWLGVVDGGWDLDGDERWSNVEFCASRLLRLRQGGHSLARRNFCATLPGWSCSNLMGPSWSGRGHRSARYSGRNWFHWSDWRYRSARSSGRRWCNWTTGAEGRHGSAGSTRSARCGWSSGSKG